MNHQMKLAQAPFEKIASGKKIIESRLYDEKRQKINVGDVIEFLQNENSEQKISKKVRALYRYAAFEEMFVDFPAEYFGGESKEYLSKEIHQFYSPEEEKQFGVIGIRLE